MTLSGSFPRTLDEKLRVAIPRRLRLDNAGGEIQAYFIGPGTDGSLVLYTEGAFERLADRLAESSPTHSDVRAFARLFYGRAQQADLDRQGRIRIPPELAALAGIGKEVILLGVRDHLELWAADRWQAYLAEKQPAYDQIAERALAESHLRS